MEEVSGQTLKPFFQQWLFTAGHPILDIHWKYNRYKKEVNITVIQKQQVLFQFPLELLIGNNMTKQLSIKDRETRITIPASVQPATITADPRVNLLFEGNVKETN
jgi:aminopeptidase N